ncbi:hypothetical protein AZE42_01857, partial [Rhizopogon vesiculosus]
MGSFTPRTA